MFSKRKSSSEKATSLPLGPGLPTSPEGQGAFGFPSEDLSLLADKLWERRPRLFKQPFAEPLISSDELFKALLAASDRFRSGNDTTRLRFFIEHAQQLADIEEYLPRPSDGTMAGYARNVSRRLRGRRFALIAEDIQVDSPSIWLRLSQFLRALSSRISLPQGTAKATAFLGNYRCTPSGLHRGDSGNFKFMVEGKKRMWLWPGANFRSRKHINHTSNVQRYRANATIIEGRPGDVIYWPSDRWHIGETVGGFCASVSLALFVHSSPSMWRDLWDQLNHYARDRQPAMIDMQKNLSWRQMEKRASSTLKAAMKGSEIEDASVAMELNRLTSRGFGQVPPPLLGRRLPDDASVRGDRDFPIRWHAGRHHNLICSANGHAFATLADKAVVSVLERLNQGGPVRWADLARKGMRRSDLRVLLEKLIALRAVSKL